MTDKFGDWRTYPENKPEKKGVYFVTYRNKNSHTLFSEAAYYDGEDFSTEYGLEVVAWMPEPEIYKKENEAEYKKDQILKAIKVIKETCLESSCETCPFGDSAGTCLILEKTPENWTLSGESVWRALK